MQKMVLGKSNLEVSELCFGALPMGPLQKNLTLETGAAIIARALKGGINFIDTAQLYGTYEPIRRALRATRIRPVLASKSMAPDYEGMRAAVEESLRALEIDDIDIFHLHAARVPEEVDVFTERAAAWQALQDCKREGLVRAIGVSTHSVPTVRRAATVAEVDIVFPLINKSGAGILYGTIAEMETAIRLCLARNQGVYLMKALGGGCLVREYHTALSFVREKFPTPVALGMISPAEVDYNLAYFQAAATARVDLPPPTVAEKAFCIVNFLCRNCGSCIKACPNLAIARPDPEGKPQINPARCLRCGYCVGYCPQFAIRLC